ncbi:MAG: Lrp/AsnC family transcriptional regulator [Planctomycetota bacterium]|nr:Lrp/AsnC family transcriptional regulator [Planctomycetota bacterium]
MPINETNGRKFELDEIDLVILHALQKDGRISNVDLSERAGLSPSTTLERVRRLERSGVVRGYTARIDPRALGHDVVVFVQVTMRDHDQVSLQRFEDAIASHPDVLECHHVAGDYDFLLKVLARNVDELRKMLVERLSVLPGVGRIHTMLTLATVKHVLDVPLKEPAAVAEAARK